MIQFRTGQEFLQAITRNVKQPEQLAEAFDAQAYESRVRFNEFFSMLLGILGEINRSYQTVATKFMRCVYIMTERIVKPALFYATCSDYQLEQLRRLLGVMIQCPAEARISDPQEVAGRIMALLDEHRSQSSSFAGSSFRLPMQRLAMERLARAYPGGDMEPTTAQQVLLELRTRPGDCASSGVLMSQYLISLYGQNGDLYTCMYFAGKFVLTCARRGYCETLRGFNEKFLGGFPLKLQERLEELQLFLLQSQRAYLDAIQEVSHTVLPKAMASLLLGTLFVAAPAPKAHSAIWKAQQEFCTKHFKEYVEFLLVQKNDLMPMHMDQFFRLTAAQARQLGADVLLKLLRQLPCVYLSNLFTLKLLQERQFAAHDIQLIMGQEISRQVGLLFFSGQNVAGDASYLLQEAIMNQLGHTRLASSFLALLRDVLSIPAPHTPEKADPETAEPDDFKRAIFSQREAELGILGVARIANLIQGSLQDFYLYFYLNRQVAQKLLFILSQRLCAESSTDTLRLLYWTSQWGLDVQPELVWALVQSGEFPPEFYYYLIQGLVNVRASYNDVAQLVNNQQFQAVLREARMLFRD